MRFRVDERFVESKFDDRKCEDIIIVNDDFAAVIDGASDATGAQFAGQSGGRFAAEVVAATIETLPPSADARMFADTLAAAVADAVTTIVGVLDDDTRWPAAVVICTSLHRREVWRIGDGNVVIDGIEHIGTKRVDAAAYGFRAAANSALLAKGTPVDELIATDPGARAARFLIDNQQHLANKVGPWGFGCINGRRVPDDYIEVLPIPDGVVEIILTSDGYPSVRSTLDDTEAALQRLIRSDPLAIDELWSVGKSTKPGANAPDDRAYLRFTICA